MVPVHRLAYSFGWEGSEEVPPGSSLVEIDLMDEAPDGTLLRLTHTGLPNQEQCDSHEEGWTHYVGRLAEVAAGRNPGPDPFLGRKSESRPAIEPASIGAMDLPAPLAWLLDEASAVSGADRFLAQLGGLLAQDGLPVAGGALTLALPHPIIARRTWLWRAEDGAVVEGLGFAGTPTARAVHDWLTGLEPCTRIRSAGGWAACWGWAGETAVRPGGNRPAAPGGAICGSAARGAFSGALGACRPARSLSRPA